jgi:hypothetical protein
MCEQQGLKGDEILFSHGIGLKKKHRAHDLKTPGVDQLMNHTEIDTDEFLEVDGEDLSPNERLLEGEVESEISRQIHIVNELPSGPTPQEEQGDRDEFLAAVSQAGEKLPAKKKIKHVKYKRAS